VFGYRVRAQQLDRDDVTLDDSAALDLGVQDTGPDGSRWALANRGVDVAALAADELAFLWTLRGAPHAYRRSDLPSIAAATQPFSEADAGKRVFDASKQLKAAGIPVLDALDTVAATMREIVTQPMVKGDVSTELSVRLDPPYLRWCRPCQATHAYEQTFRLGASRGGLELQAGTSPPVLDPIPGYFRADEPGERHNVMRGYLRLLGPATPRHVAAFLDAPVRDVKAQWPDDAVEVIVDGEQCWVLASDESALDVDPPRVVRLLGPYDLFVQAQDRPLLVPDKARAKTLWPVLGRPGAVLVDGAIAGWWRPRKSGAKLKLTVELWSPAGAATRRAIEQEAERLAAFRQVQLSAVELDH
jgi:hypothetical protein